MSYQIIRYKDQFTVENTSSEPLVISLTSSDNFYIDYKVTIQPVSSYTIPQDRETSYVIYINDAPYVYNSFPKLKQEMINSVSSYLNMEKDCCNEIKTTQCEALLYTLHYNTAVSYNYNNIPSLEYTQYKNFINSNSLHNSLFELSEQKLKEEYLGEISCESGQFSCCSQLDKYIKLHYLANYFFDKLQSNDDEELAYFDDLYNIEEMLPWLDLNNDNSSGPSSNPSVLDGSLLSNYYDEYLDNACEAQPPKVEDTKILNYIENNPNYINFEISSFIQGYDDIFQRPARFVKIVSTESINLFYNGNPVTPNQVIDLEDIHLLTSSVITSIIEEDFYIYYKVSAEGCCNDENFGDLVKLTICNVYRTKVESIDCNFTASYYSLQNIYEGVGFNLFSSIPYTNGSGEIPTQIITSDNHPNVTITLSNTFLLPDGGNIPVNIQGVPSSTDTILFSINIGNKFCVIPVSVDPQPNSAPTVGNFTTTLDNRVDYNFTNFTLINGTVPQYSDPENNPPLFLTLIFTDLKGGSFTLNGSVVNSNDVIPYNQVSNLVWNAPEVDIATTVNVTYGLSDRTDSSYFSFAQIIIVNNSKPVAATIPPTIDAGADITITLPQSTIQFNAVIADTDPNSGATFVNWVQVSGPNQVNFDTNMAVNTQISNLIEGTYIFRGEVTNDIGGYNSDLITITVLPEPVISSPVKASPVLDCADAATVTSPSITLYTSQRNFVGSVGAVLYVDIQLTTPFSGNSDRYMFFDTNDNPLPGILYTIDSNGVIEGTLSCTTLPPITSTKPLTSITPLEETSCEASQTFEVKVPAGETRQVTITKFGLANISIIETNSSGTNSYNSNLNKIISEDTTYSITIQGREGTMNSQTTVSISVVGYNTISITRKHDSSPNYC